MEGGKEDGMAKWHGTKKTARETAVRFSSTLTWCGERQVVCVAVESESGGGGGKSGGKSVGKAGESKNPPACD